METEDTHTEKPDLTKKYSCDICKEDFSTQPDLRQHLVTGDSGKYTCVSPKKALESIENKTSPTKISVKSPDENSEYLSPKRALEPIEEDENETSPAKISRTECKFKAKKCSGGCN